MNSGVARSLKDSMNLSGLSTFQPIQSETIAKYQMVNNTTGRQGDTVLPSKRFSFYICLFDRVMTYRQRKTLLQASKRLQKNFSESLTETPSIQESL